MPGPRTTSDSRRSSRVRRSERSRHANRPPRTSRRLLAAVAAGARSAGRAAIAAARASRHAARPVARRAVRIGRLARLSALRLARRIRVHVLRPLGLGRLARPRIALLGAGAIAVIAVGGIAVNAGVQAGVGNGGDVGAVIDAIESGEALPYDDATGSVAGDGRRSAPIRETPGGQGGAKSDAGAELPDPTQPQPKPTPNPSPPASEQPSPSPAPPVTTQRPHPPISDDPADPMSPKYNPYTTPGDPAFVSETERRAWLGREQVVRECMAEAGFEYLEWQWWFGGSPQPGGMDAAESAAWMQALRGAGSSGSVDGCEAVAQRAADEAQAAGTPLQGDLLPQPDGPTEREQWLEFQDAVRGCMNTAGQEYLYWEHWNSAYAGANGALPAMPPEFDERQRAVWEDVLYGGAASSEGATSGCWAQGAADTGYASWR